MGDRFGFEPGQRGYVVSIDKSKVGGIVESHDGFCFKHEKDAQTEAENFRNSGTSLDVYVYEAEIVSLDHNDFVKDAKVLALT